MMEAPSDDELIDAYEAGRDASRTWGTLVVFYAARHGIEGALPAYVEAKLRLAFDRGVAERKRLAATDAAILTRHRG